MTDKEKTEEDKFRQILQDACSFSDEQLLRDLEKAEKALGEFEFSGAEERIFKKLMEREAMNTERMREEGEEGKEGEEKAAEKVPETVPEKESKKVAERVSEVASQKEPEATMVKAPGTASVEASEKVPEAALQTTSEENADKALGEVSEKISEAATAKAAEEVSKKMPVAASQTISEENADKALGGVSEKISEATSQTATGKGKVLRFGRRKRMLMVALVAAFVGMLGAKAVGGNSYFFQFNPKSAGVILDNGRNHTNIGDLNEAYKIASQELQIKVLRLGYIPKRMKFIELNINENKAVFVFRYEKVKVHIFQIQRLKETSFDFNSDSKREGVNVYNKWFDQNVSIWEETIDSQKGYSAVLTIGDGVYYITGAIPEAEMKQIVENLNFY